MVEITEDLYDSIRQLCIRASQSAIRASLQATLAAQQLSIVKIQNSITQMTVPLIMMSTKTSTNTPISNPNSPFLAPPSKPTLPSSYPIKRLTYSEMEQLRDQGLCLNCKDIDTPNHRCPIKRIVLAIPDEDAKNEHQSMEILKPVDPEKLFNLDSKELPDLEIATTFVDLGSTREYVGVISQKRPQLNIKPRCCEKERKTICGAIPKAVEIIKGRKEKLHRQKDSYNVLINFYLLNVCGADVAFDIHRLQTLGLDHLEKALFVDDAMLFGEMHMRNEVIWSIFVVYIFDPGIMFGVMSTSDLEDKVVF